MPQFDLTTREKIDDLRALRAAGTTPDIYETVKIAWPDPTDPIYYSVLPLDELPIAMAVSPIDVRLVAGPSPRYFQPVTIDSSIGDEELELTFGDIDGVFADLLEEHGEGALVELYYWFPQVELLLPVWLGHLRHEDEAEIDRVKIKAVNGFRTPDAVLPRRGHYHECDAIYGMFFDTQAEINENGCPVNVHIGGSIGNPLLTFCPRRTLGQCTERIGNAYYMLSHQTVIATVVNNQTKGNRLLSTSRGNETALDEAVRVVMGTRRIWNCPVLVERRDYNNNDPGKGFYTAIYELCHGPIQSISNVVFTANGIRQAASFERYNQNLGQKGQIPLDVSLTTHAFSMTALVRYYMGWINPAEVETSEAHCDATINGLTDIRVYTDQTTYTEYHNSIRIWHILKMMCDKIWGYGLDYQRFNMASLIECADWGNNFVRFTDPEGQIWDHQRDRSDVELVERKATQQIEDMCLAGGLSRPFIFDGKIHIVPLKKLSALELAACPVFYDEGDNRNVIRDKDNRSTLTRSKKSDSDLINRIECSYDKATAGYTKQSAPPAEDIDYQLKAGRITGDRTRKVNKKSYHLLGTTDEAQVVKTTWRILDLGPFDEGGIANNLRIKFKIWCIDALDLHPYKVIKVVANSLTRYGFQYFRVMEMERDDDLSVEITAQAYNETYMETFEVEFADIPGDPPDDPIPPGPPAPDPVPCVLKFGGISYTDGSLAIPIDPC